MFGMTALANLGTPRQRLQLKEFLALVRQANARVNLVSRQDIANLVEHHLAPSCLFFVLKRIAAGERILDIGSGGGFPGMVCAILQPASWFVLVDSTRKKTDFLKTAVQALQLTNVQVLWQRVETMATDPHWQQAFDRSISRAVAPLSDVVRWSEPLLKPGGSVEALKGRAAATAEATQQVQPVEFHTPPVDWQWNSHLNSVTIVTVLPKLV